MKAVSTIVATILMLAITIALAGTAWMYINNVFTGTVKTTFSIVDNYNDTITIRNMGTATINDIKATLDGKTVNVAIAPSISGLVGYWSFNDGSGSTASDSSGNGNTGTLINGPTWIDGKYGKGLSFDGNINWVNIAPSVMNGLSDFTVTYWMKTSDNTKSGTPLHATNTGNNEFIGPYDYRSANVYVKDVNWNSGVALNDGTWKHVAITRKGDTGEVNLFVNGVSKGSANLPAGVLTVNCLVLGQEEDSVCDAFDVNQAFLGVMDEVGIFNKVLSQNEINSLSSGLVSPGQTATIKPLTSLSTGTHTLKLCTSSMCTTGYLTIS